MEHAPIAGQEVPAQQPSESLRQPFHDETAFALRDGVSPVPTRAIRFPGCEPEPPDPRFDEPFPQAWLVYLRDNVFLYRLLSDADQARLRYAVRRFIAAKFWEGCAGLQVTEEMQVTIAGQACVLVLGFKDYWFQQNKTILVYPGGYLGNDPQEMGDRPNHRLGEAHERGPVVLSWWHAHWGGYYWSGHNVVLHEFAHKLAELGDPNIGLPPTNDPRQTERWNAVLADEYRQLIEDADYQRPTLLSAYGATNLAEFFAVATECFFLRPLALGQRHPALYQLLAEWYCQDPAQWRVDEATAAHTVDAEEEELRHTLIECDAVLDHFPDYLEGYQQRAACWRALGAFDNALADCNRIVDLAGKRAKAAAYCERGWIHYEAGSYAQAIADFSEAIYRTPDLADAYCGRGSVYAVRGETGKAITDLTRALRLDPKDDAALLCRASVRRETGEHKKALRDLQGAIRLCPHRPDGYRERGLVYLRMKDYDRAIADFSEAIRLDSDDADVYAARAEAFAAQGATAAAERDRAKAEQMRPSSDATPSRPHDGIVRGEDPRLVGLRRSSPRQRP
ncbi:MAG TPA: zinc-dependent peptidase [Gemmataceae bacterium]|nr:zinc-dependent peptidase [Gemmataceae bacterium]